MKTLLRHNLIAIALFVLALLSLPLTGFAQDGNDNQEKIKSMQAVFFTEQLQLTPKEAQDFWPLYSNYREEIKNINQQMRTLESDNSLSPEQRLSRKNQLEEQKLSVSKKYQEQFKRVLPVAKVAQIDRVEREFKMWILSQVKQRP
ncbi:hypothetical protein C7N43_22805 [Sphingobacteriales bacterium UPWRP_1]|nr:hypothetical protein B6N25_14860 [Sphingobacteriales bacterium TSM_CSS]PSJ74672.1 hypothetical protein C7N43_22805 [Sphingobacteriales bacterium UPWRP_1]